MMLSDGLNFFRAMSSFFKKAASPRAGIAAAALLLASSTTIAQSSVTTQHYDIARTGANTNETILTPSNVNSTTFGKLFSVTVDGYVYAQPLYMPGVTMGPGTAQAGTTHNVVFIVTEHDSVYALDADSNTGANATPLWQVSLIDAAHGGNVSAGEKTVPAADVEYNPPDITPEIGITSTPVIDPTTNTIYVVAKSTIGDTQFFQKLHALDITTGAEKFGGPVALAAAVPGTGNGSSGGTLNFDPKWQHNRASSLLLNGIIYMGFGSHMDQGPWHGWILAYNATTLTRTGAWCSSPNASAGGIWMGGTGLAADVPSGKPYGRMFTATGNGTFDAVAPNYTNSMDYGDSILKLDLNNGVPTMVSAGTVVGDDFTPHNQATLNNNDTDQASGGVMLLPDSVGNGGRQLVQVGKSALLYVLNRENLGGYNPNNASDPEVAATLNGGLWGSPAYWNGNIYVWAVSDHLKAFGFANGALTSSTPTSQSNESAGTYSPSPTVSANGTTNGIVWSIRSDNSPQILYAHSAANVSDLLYSSLQNSTRDNPGGGVKFIVPTVMNGKVYIGGQYQISVYGLLQGAQQAATPGISPGSETFNTSLQVTISDSTNGASIYYTTDGSTPSTASTPYTGPFTITSTTTVNAIAGGTGFLASPVASATYTLQTQAVAPVFNPAPGTYTTAQSVAITTTTPNATIYYTTNGLPPTTASTVYAGPVVISSGNVTLSAIAVASGLSNSPVTSGVYSIQPEGASSINFGSGFTSGGGMDLLGSAAINGTALQLTNGGSNEAAAAWYGVEANIQSFTTDFVFQITPASGNTADGLTFTIQGNNASSIGPSGGGLGYGPDSPTGTAAGIGSSIAVKFDLYSNAGEGTDSTGLYENGASPTTPANDMTSSGVNLHSGDPMHVHMTYDGTTLTMSITDLTTNASYSTSWPVDIPSIVGGNSAYIGFTGGTGGETATQSILNWTYVSGSASQTVATPTFSPAAGTYLGTQTVTISDGTSGATIYYTTNGTTPTTSSTQYTGAITVTGSETIQAIAVASGYTQSAVGSAAYVIESQVAAPTFSPTAGTYVGPQTVTISTASSGATIYYTTNGTTPTTSSTQYTGPITVSSSETIEAIAVASGYFNSNVSTASYVINAGTGAINLGSGFSAVSMTLNGKSTLNGTRLRLTDGGGSEAASAWYASAVNVQQFSTSFTFQITGGTNPTADGFAFVIQDAGTTALGPSGGGLGYGPDGPGGTLGIPKSIAVKFDLYSNAGEGTDSTGLYTDGASPTVPADDMTSSGVNLHTGDVFNVQMNYNGTTLAMTITDTTTNATYTQSWTVNIPGTVGANTAYVGFTGGTGGDTAIQEIIGWTFTPGNLPTAATPVISPAAGTYTTAQSVTISDATSGATIYYTTNGTTPTTSSTQYTGAITVSASETIEAIAVATGYTQSAVGSAAYTINLAAAATPAISPAAGTYTTAQSVTISDATSGATIYYTTNGTTPTTSSTQYTGAITVSASETIEAIAVATGYTQSAVASASYTITPPAATPTFSPAAGTYTSAQSVTISDATSGATIYYTTNGTTPTTSSTKYTGPVSVGSSETIEAIAVATGYTQSAVASAAYTINLTAAATPVISPAAGTYTTAQSVTISDATSGATIYYTTNGTTPTTSSTQYTGAITVSASETIEAIAVATGYTQSAVASAAYTITPPAATPVISPAAGTYTSAQTVTISDTTSGATIYYTTNGAAPTTSSNKYTGPVSVSSSETVQAIAVATGYTQSAVASAAYTINLPAAATPVISPAAGTYTTAQSVTISDATSGATIYYTTNGTTPTTSSTQYTGAITVSASETIEAIAVATGYTQSAVASAGYTITPPAATPVISPGSGTYTSAQTVTITDTTSGAKIYYTTNGTTPTTSSTLYSGPITVSGSETIEAIAVAAGYTQSVVATAAITIQSGSTTPISLGSGFSASGMQFNGSTKLNGTALQLTDTSGTYEVGSAFWTQPVNVQSFHTNFTFQLTSAHADGFTFTIQNTGITALGPDGGGLGYGPDNTTNPSSSPNKPIASSIAVKFDLYNNAGEGTNSTGLYINGASPTVPATTLGGGVVLSSGHPIAAQIVYNGTTLTLTLTDTTNTSLTFTTSWTVNIPSAVGGNTAYVGFTGGTGGQTALQDVLNWTYSTP